MRGLSLCGSRKVSQAACRWAGRIHLWAGTTDPAGRVATSNNANVTKGVVNLLLTAGPLVLWLQRMLPQSGLATQETLNDTWWVAGEHARDPACVSFIWRVQCSFLHCLSRSDVVCSCGDLILFNYDPKGGTQGTEAGLGLQILRTGRGIRTGPLAS